jgi:hypothetical protein
LTRFIYDEFSKDYLEMLFSDYGLAEAGKTVASEVLEIDMYFSPNSPELPPNLGLLGRFAQTRALFEPYRNPVTLDQILDCLGKLIAVRQALRREANRQNQKLETAREPRLWILTPTASPRIIASIEGKLKPQWGEGVYFMTETLRTALVVIHQLPETNETLWLRILGKGGIQSRAIDELEALPPNHPFKARTLELLYNLSRNLEVTNSPIEEDRTLIMRLAPLYQQDRQLAIQEGIEQGIEQGIERGIEQGMERGRQVEGVSLILRLLTRRIGAIPVNLVEQIRQLPIEALENLGEALLDFQNETDLVNWLEQYR